MIQVPSNVTSGSPVAQKNLPEVKAQNRTWGAAFDTATIKCEAVLDMSDPRANNSKSFEGGDLMMPGQELNTTFSALDVTATPGSVVPVKVECTRYGVALSKVYYDLSIRPCRGGEIYLGHEQRICLQCLDGTFAKSPGEPVKQCHKCDKENVPGAVCDHADGTSIERMRAQESFWITNRSSFKFYRCPVKGSCIGGIHTNGTTIRSRCSLGHTSVLCSQCNHGYSPGSGGRCKKCDVIRDSSEKGWIVWFVTTGLLILVAVGYLAAVVKAESGSKAWSFLKMIRGKEMSKMDHALEEVQDQARTIISFAQIFASFGLSFSSKTDFAGEGQRMVLPLAVLEICRFLDVFTFNFADLVGQIAPCDTSLSFSAKFVLWMAALPTLLAVIAVAHQVVVHTHLRHVEDTEKRAKLQMIVTDTAIVTANTCCFLLWPTIGRTIFQVFTFTTVEGQVYLLFDMTIQPNDEWWPALAGVAILGTIVYIIGVPVFYFVVLYKQRKWLMSPAQQDMEHWIQRRYSGLFKQFEPAYWYWELIEMLRKLLLIGGVLVLQLNPTVQALFGLLVAIFYIVLLGNTRPYLDDSTDAVAQIGAVTMVLVLLLGSALSWWSGLQPPGPSLSAVEADGRWAAIRFFSGLSATILGVCIALCVGVVGYTVWSAKDNEKPWCTCCGGKKTGAKVHPVERVPEQGDKMEPTEEMFDPETCSDNNVFRAEYAKVKRRLAELEAENETYALTRTNTTPKSKTLTVPHPNRLKRNSSIDKRLHSRRLLTDETHAQLIIKEHHEEHAASQRQLLQAQEASAELGSHKRLLKEIRHKMRGRMLAEVLESTLGLTGDDHIIEFDQAVRLFEAILERSLDRAVVKKSLARCDKNGDGRLDLDELRRIVGERSEAKEME